MKCVYAKYHDDRPPCCTHECDGCLWCDEVETEEDERCIDRQKDMINSFAYIPLDYRINCPLWYPKKEE